MKVILRWGLRLGLIHLLMILNIWLATFFPTLDYVLNLIYLILIWGIGNWLSKTGVLKNPGQALSVSLLAQMPGWVLVVLNLALYQELGGIIGDYPYMLQIWYTPFIPMLSLFSFKLVSGYAAYFIGLFFMPVMYALVFMAGYLTSGFFPHRNARVK